MRCKAQASAFLSLLGRIGLNSVTKFVKRTTQWIDRFKEMHKQDPSLLFPMLVWDTFPKSGASQVIFFYKAELLFFRFTLTCRLGLVELPILDILKHNSGSSVFIKFKFRLYNLYISFMVQRGSCIWEKDWESKLLERLGWGENLNLTLTWQSWK